MGRPHKRHKYKLEQLIKNTWLETNRGRSITTQHQAIVIKSIAQALEHFETEDELSKGKTEFVRVFETLYLSTPVIKMNYRINLFETASMWTNSTLSAETITKFKTTTKNNKGLKTREGYAKNTFYMDSKTLLKYTNTCIACFEIKLRKNGYIPGINI